MNKTKMFHIYWGAVAILLPIWLRVGQSNNVEDSKSFFFLFATLFSLFCFGLRPKLSPIYLALGYLVLAAYFHQFDSTRFYVIDQTIFFILGALVLVQILDLASVKYQNIIIKSLAITCIVQSLWAFSEFFGRDPYLWLIPKTAIKLDFLSHHGWFQVISDETHINGSFANENNAGALIALTFPALFYAKFYMAIPVALIALVLFNSTMPVVAACAGVVALFSAKKLNQKQIKIIALTGIGLLLAFLLCIGPDEDGLLGSGPRAWLWRNIWKIIRPGELIFGMGPGFFAEMFPRNFLLYGVIPFRQMHNEYLEILFCFGAVGIGVFYFLYNQIYRQKLHPIFFGVLAAALVSSVGHFPFHITSTALVGIIAYAFLLKQENYHGI